MNTTTFVCIVLATAASLSAQAYPKPKSTPNGYPKSEALTKAGVREMREVFLTHAVDYKSSTISIRYGVAPYSDEVARSIGAKEGRFPFGKGTWARLETNVPVTIGDKTVEPGIYCLALERSKAGWGLVLFADQQIRYRNLASWQLPPVGELGTSCPLQHEWTEPASDSFTVQFEEDGYQPGKGTLRIQFGTRQWSAPVAMDVTKARSAQTTYRSKTDG